MSKQFRHHSGQEVLDLVANTELRFENGKWAGPHASAKLYRKVGTWLLDEKYLHRLIFDREWREKRSLPGLKSELSTSDVLWLLWKRGFARRVSGDCAAQAVRVKKTNIRAFYVQKKAFSTKIVFDEEAGRLTRLENEIKTRQRVTSLKCLQTPALLEYDLKETPAYYREELVWGRKCSETDGKLVLSELFPRLARFYAAAGISWKRVRQVLPLKFPERVRRAIERVKWNGRWQSKDAFLKTVSELLQQKAFVPCSFCHGDLQPSNLIITPAKEIYVVDWEAARDAAIVFDFAKMMWFFSWARSGVEDLVRRFGNPPNNWPMLSLPAQVLFANLQLIAGRESRVEAYLRTTRRKENFVADLTDLFGWANALMVEVERLSR